MKSRTTLFLDSDVVLSALLSPRGAAQMLMHQASVIRFTSDLAIVEQSNVIEKFGIDLQEYQNLKKLFFVTPVMKDDVKKFTRAVFHPLDAHIVAGAVASKAKFLVTYSLKDYRAEVINKSWNIIVITPGFLLQYLRSQ